MTHAIKETWELSLLAAALPQTYANWSPARIRAHFVLHEIDEMYTQNGCRLDVDYSVPTLSLWVCSSSCRDF